MYSVLGLMSGTSLDGLDLALCNFNFDKNQWTHEIRRGITIPYSREWRDKLATAHACTGYELALLDIEYGRYLGKMTREFVEESGERPRCIASHGHTIFHRPELGLTFQLGKGAAIAAETGIDTISDFRALDVVLGGQGAPLVPIGDELLFGEYDACVNLGGFANVSTRVHGRRVAWDICPVNIVLNELAREKNMEYDRDGLIGRIGAVDSRVLDELNQLDYYSGVYPKSLGREWVEKNFWPVLASISSFRVEDRIRTIYAHVVHQIGRDILACNARDVLVTGGGALNAYLLELLRQEYKQVNWIIPDELLVHFKEALIFAFLGVLRLEGIPNCLSAVTGARVDNRGGVIWSIADH